jgi:Leucine-rich repeat (LRR) protein
MLILPKRSLLSQTKKMLTLVVTTLFFICRIYAQNIPDANFAAAIRADCPSCITASPENNLTAAAASRTILRVEGQNITNLTGLNGFVNLTGINCRRNNLTSLPVLPPNLNYLDCSVNRLTQLPAIPNSQRTLYCYDNLITSLPPLPTELQFLRIDQERIFCLPNAITGVITTGDYFNTTISLSVCGYIPDANFAAAIREECPTCISASPENMLTPEASMLMTLNASNRNIANWEGIYNFVNLKSFNCSSNNMAKLPWWFSRLTELTNFDCSNNSIEYISYPNDVIALLTKLTHLNFSGNLRAGLPNFANLQLLTNLKCSGIGLQYFPSLPQLTNLDCSNNFIQVIPQLSTSLTELKCQNNLLVALPSLPANLANLMIDADKIPCIPNAISGTIRDASGNTITRPICAVINIPDANFAAAIRLDCPTCITPSPENNLTSEATVITRLDVENKNVNNLTGLNGFPSLTFLKCSRNNLTSLPALPSKLNYFECNGNALTQLPTLPNSLGTLYCHNNNITSLPALPYNLQFLRLDDNRISCLPNTTIRMGYAINANGMEIVLPICGTCVGNQIEITQHPNINPIFSGVNNTYLCKEGGLFELNQYPSNPGLTVEAKPIADGTPLQIKWQRKRDTDADFVDITSKYLFVNIKDQKHLVDYRVSQADNNAQFRAVFSSTRIGSCSGSPIILPAYTTATRANIAVGGKFKDPKFTLNVRNSIYGCTNICGGLTYCNTFSNQSAYQAFTETSLIFPSGGIDYSDDFVYFPSLQNLSITGGELTTLSNLPNSLRYLSVTAASRLNEIVSFPTYVESIELVSDLLLLSLPPLPSSLSSLSLTNVGVRCLPTLPNSLTLLRINPSEITCLPNSVAGLSVRNYTTNEVISLPLCAPSIVTSPTASTLQCVGTSLTLLAKATGAVQVKWQKKALIDADFTDVTTLSAYISGTDVFFQIPTLVEADNGTQYRSVFVATCGNITNTMAATIAFIQPIAANAPTTISPICPSETTLLTAKATNATFVKWQRKRTTDANYTDVTSITAYTPNSETTFRTQQLFIADNGTQFRAVFSNTCNPTPFTTDPVTLVVTNITTIPDVKFQNAIRQVCPACINTCNNLTLAARNQTSLILNNLPQSQLITDFTGIDGFTNLSYLDISNNNMTVLPNNLPNSIKTLICRSNKLTSISQLPNQLEKLLCSGNLLTQLPTLPSTILELDCYDNRLTNLPTLPNGLRILYSAANPLSNLPTLPNSLLKLYCYENTLSELPELPNSLQLLHCASNNLIQLPILPSNLITLDCSSNSSLSCLPSFPSTLTSIYLSQTLIGCIGNMPSNLKNYNANFIQISLPPLCSSPLPVVVSSEIVNTTLGQTVTFTTRANGSAAMLVKWRRKAANSMLFVDIPNSHSPYIPPTFTTYTTNTLTVSDNGAQYVAVFSSNCLDFITTRPITVNVTAPLPVELLTFTGNQEGKMNVLSWAVAAQSKVARFVMERSETGRDNWLAIGDITPQKDSKTTLFYNFEDAKPLHFSYYRLVIVDLDGTKNYSKTLSLIQTTKQLSIEHIFPNPVVDKLYITYQVPKTAQVSLTISNVLGQIITTQTVTAKEGVNNTEIDMTSFGNGVFYLLVNDGNVQAVNKIVKN